MSTTDAVLVGVADGERTVYVGPELDDNLPPVVLEGLTRRRLVGLGQPCPQPCGARMVVPNRAERRAARKAGPVLHVQIEHHPDCAAVSDELEAYVRRCR
jgi:hypothetical protein